MTTDTNGNTYEFSKAITTAQVFVQMSGPATAAEGDNLIYPITVANTGGSDLSNIELADTVPAGTAYVSAGSSFSGGSLSFAGGVVTVAIPSLAAGASDTGTIELTALEENPSLTNTLTMVDPATQDAAACSPKGCGVHFCKSQKNYNPARRFSHRASNIQ
jgi:uncharacterized repeat protein (TIGR01451 family)